MFRVGPEFLKGSNVHKDKTKSCLQFDFILYYMSLHLKSFILKYAYRIEPVTRKVSSSRLKLKCNAMILAAHMWRKFITIGGR